MKSVGIDIGSFSVKVAEIDASAKSYEIVGFQQFPLNQNPNADREIELIEILREIAKRYDPAQTRFVVGVPQDRVSLRHKFFPFRERLKILKSLPFELEDDIPLNQDAVIFDARIISYRGSHSEVLAVACPKDEVSHLLSTCQDSGIDPDIVTVESFAFANLFESWHLPPPQLPELPETTVEDTAVTAVAPLVNPERTPATLVLHIGHQRTMATVFKDRSLIEARTILWGARDVAEGLSQQFHVSLPETLKALPSKAYILLNEAGASRDQIQVSKTVASSIDDLVRELRLTIAELMTGYDLKIEKVELLGGGSQIKNFAPYLTQRLEIPVNLFSHFDVYNRNRIPRTPENESASPVAIGLAIEGLKRGQNPPVNLRKNEFTKKNRAFERVWNKWKHAVQLGSAALILFFAYTLTRSYFAEDLALKAEENLKDQARVQAGLSGPRARPTQIRSHIRSQRNRIQHAESLEKLQSITSALQVINQATEVMPPNRQGSGPRIAPLYDILRFQVNFDNVTIEGEAVHASVIPQIEQALRQISAGGQVKPITPTVTVAPGKRPFAFQWTVDRVLSE